MNFCNRFAVCLFVALPIAMSCSKEQESTPPASREISQTKSEPSASSTLAPRAAGQDKGTIAGKVVFKGKYSPGKLPVGKDKEVCGEAKPDPALIVGDDGGIKNAVIQIAGLKEGRTPAKEAELDQVKCEYVPHVLVVPAGGTVKIKNSDGILHNVHTVSRDNKPFNRAQPKFLKEISEIFSKPETIAVRCDVHGWMSGWIVVTDNVYYEVSQADGAFKLTDVPAGKHSVEVWHEKLGKVSRAVEVKPGETVDIRFEMGLQN